MKMSVNENRIFIILRHLIFTLIGSIAIAFTIVNFLLSCCKLAIINIIYYFTTGDKIDILWGSDALMQYQGSTYFTSQECTAISSVVILLKGSPDVFKWRQAIKNNLFSDSTTKENFKPFMRFRQKVVRKFGYYVWKTEDPFQLESHVRLHDHSFHDRTSLMKIVSDISHKSLLSDLSPWEIVLIPEKSQTSNADKEATTYVVLFRIHHSLGDGILTMKFIMSMGDEATKQKMAGKY